MLCQRCQQRTATVRVTKVNNGIRETNYLCEKCAAETGAVNLFGGMGANFIPAEQMNRVSRRLTERAQKALAIAEQEAKDRHSAYINTCLLYTSHRPDTGEGANRIFRDTI